MSIKLNCESGDIAYVYRVTSPKLEWLLKPQKFVQVVNLQFVRAEPMWTLAEPIPAPTACPNCGERHNVERLPDAWLRPIRNKPGQDETLDWAGLPKKTEVPETV